MKPLLITLLSVLALWALALNAFAATVFLPQQGGTGVGTALIGDIGKCLTVSNNNPFTYVLGSCSGVGGSGTVSTSTTPVIGNLSYWTSASQLGTIATGTLSTNATGLQFDATRALVGGSAVLSLASGYGIPLTASTTNWNAFYNTPSNRITDGTNLTWSGNTLNVDDPFSVGSLTVTSSAALSGATTTVKTVTAGDSSTNAASTAFVTTAVNNAIAGVNPAVSVVIATTQSSDTSGLTYSNGASGVGATLTGSVNTPITIDGVTLTSLNQRVLVKNDTVAPSGSHNGVYYLSQLQTAILPPVLTRALDYNQPSDINNTGAVPVVSGTVNANTSWILTSTVSTVGTDALTYAQFTVSPSSIPTLAGNNSFTGTNAFTKLTVSASSTLGYASSSALTVSGTSYFGNFTATAGTSTNLQATTLGVGSSYFTSLLGSGLLNTTGSLTCATANSSTFGCLSSTDWTTFNAKAPTDSPTFTGTAGFANYTATNGTTTNSTSTNLAVSTSFKLLTDVITSVSTWFSAKLNAVSSFAAAAASTWDFSGATSVQMPVGTNPTVTAAGSVAIDTSDNQLVVATSTTAFVLRGKSEIYKFSVPSTSPMFATGTVKYLPRISDGYVVDEIWCGVEGGTYKIINLLGSNLTCLTADGATTSPAITSVGAASTTVALTASTTLGVVNWLNVTITGRWVRK